MNRTTRHTTLALALAAPLLLAAACTKKGGASTRGEAGGDVARTWTPRAESGVLGVPIEVAKSAIQQRLAAARPSALNADKWTHVHTLYAQFSGDPLWFDKNGLITTRTQALTKALLDAQDDALRLDAYPLADVVQALNALRASPHPSAEQVANADVVLTSAYVALGEDMLTGQVDPKKLSQDWHISTRETQVDSALTLTMRSDELDRGIAEMRPQNPGYDALRKELVRFRELAAKGDWPRVPEGKLTRPGEFDSPARLAALRQRLAAEGYLASAAPPDSSARSATPPAPTTESTRRPPPPATRRPSPRTGPGIYDHALAGAVADFQAHHGIAVDSMLGAETVAALNVPAQYRLAQIAANLERYRWLPRILPQRYILVNVPAFHLTAFDSGRKSLDMKVIVGQEYEDKKTPVFSDSMQFVVFRPYWLVTPDIQKKELEPKIAADPSYMEANAYEYYTDHGQQRIRQKPGEKNALGYVKFLFPNDFNIYLHDTPQRDLFRKDVRAFSHGCIRAEKPVELAQWVLGWDAGRIEQAMHSGPDNKQVTLPRKIPVYIVYFTTYVQDGQLYFGNDLYHRDDAIVALVGDAAAERHSAALQAVHELQQTASAMGKG